MEACTNLETIDCSNNGIPAVILPRLTKLTTLRCYGNPVEKLDLTGCSALQALYLQDVSTNAVSGTSITVSGYSQAASLTFFVADTPFTSLTVSGSGMLASIDVTANSQLTSLDCSGNTALQNIDVSSLTALQSLNLSGCGLQSLDVTHNTALTALLCNDNSIPSLDVRNCTALVTLECNTNALTTLNVSSNTALQKLDVSSNSLQAVNVRSNPALTWLDVSGNSAVNVLNVANNPALTELRATGLSISDINLSANTALTVLDLSDNAALTVLDLSSNALLEKLHLTKLPISNINLEKNTALLYLNLSNNLNMESLDLTSNTILSELYLPENISILTTSSHKDFFNKCTIRLTTPLYQYISINDLNLYGFVDNKISYLVTCERHGPSYGKGSMDYWQDKGLQLPTMQEAEIIYKHKSDLALALTEHGYIDNYFETADSYWTSTTVDSALFSLYTISLETGLFDEEIAEEYGRHYYSFGVYVK